MKVQSSATQLNSKPAGWNAVVDAEIKSARTITETYLAARSYRSVAAPASGLSTSLTNEFPDNLPGSMGWCSACAELGYWEALPTTAKVPRGTLNSAGTAVAGIVLQACTLAIAYGKRRSTNTIAVLACRRRWTRLQVALGGTIPKARPPRPEWLSKALQSTWLETIPETA